MSLFFAAKTWKQIQVAGVECGNLRGSKSRLELSTRLHWVSMHLTRFSCLSSLPTARGLRANASSCNTLIHLRFKWHRNMSELSLTEGHKKEKFKSQTLKWSRLLTKGGRLLEVLTIVICLEEIWFQTDGYL